MRTRFCANCGEPFMSDAKTDITVPFCSKACKIWHNMNEYERAKYKDYIEYEKGEKNY